MVSPAVQKALKYAAEEARCCGSKWIRLPHLFVGICRLDPIQDSASNIPQGESLLLEGLFQAAGVRTADLVKRLRDEMQVPSQRVDSIAPKYSEQCRRVLLAAREYAAEEGKTVDMCVGHLAKLLLIALCRNPAFKIIITEIGGDVRKMLEQLGLDTPDAEV